MTHQTTARPAPALAPEQPRYDFSADVSERRVLGFSGKLHSGKSTCRNFLMSMAMTHSLGILPYSYINEDGKIVGPKDENEDAIIDIDSRDPEVISFMDQKVWKFMKPFSCATPLKNFCVNVLGLEPKLVYGSQEDKNQLSEILWENIPGYTGKKKGKMRGREVMEVVGTEVVRHIRSDAWANALKNDILQYGSLHSIIDDIRFPDECLAIRSIGGKIIRLDLVTEESSKNTHVSNCALDDYNEFDATIKNSNMTIEETFKQLIEILMSWDWFKQVN